MFGWEAILPVTSSGNRARSTARAAPAGTRLFRAASKIIEPRRIASAFKSPWALDRSRDLNELEQTSSARLPVE